MNGAPTLEQVTARLVALGLAPERAQAVAPELARRLAHLAAVADARLDDTAPAIEFRVVDAPDGDA